MSKIRQEIPILVLISIDLKIRKEVPVVNLNAR